jgi:5'-nucleotidase
VRSLNRLTVAISSRALFNLDESHRVYEQEGFQAYRKYQCDNEHRVLEPGAAFNLVKKFLMLNQKKTSEGSVEPLVEVLLLSRNTPDTGLRIFNSIQHYGLNITRAAFSGGASPYRYARAFGAHLYLSLNPVDVRMAIQDGMAAAVLFDPSNNEYVSNELRFAFDGDAVLFSDVAEKVFQGEGLDRFNQSETEHAHLPLPPGPFKSFLTVLHTLQKQDLAIPLRTALVTARSAPAHERVINTLRSWDIRVDEALFLGGLEKLEFLKVFGADIFFDDKPFECGNASPHITSAHVPFGVLNDIKDPKSIPN